MQASSGDTQPVDRRDAIRVPLRRRVRLRFDTPEAFVEATTHDISATGMFVRTSCFRQPGAEIDFEIALSEEGEVIAGTGEVVRIRGGDASLQPSGMGIRYLELRGRSATIVRRVVECGTPVPPSTWRTVD